MHPIRYLCAVTAVAACAVTASAQTQSQAKVEELSATLRSALQSGTIKDEATQAKVLHALLAAWHETADGDDFATVQAAVDADLAGNAAPPPRALLACLLVTGENKYRAALEHADTTASNDPVYRMKYAAAWKQPLPTAPAATGSATPEGAQILAEIADSYAARPVPEWKSNGAGNSIHDENAWREAARRAAKPFLAHNARSRDTETQLTASYGIAKAVRLGLLPKEDARQAASLYKTGNTGTPASEAAQLLAATEIALAPAAALGRGKTVLVDAWFNSQLRKGLNGEQELFHYKWDDQENSGFSFFGSAFTRYGANLAQLDAAPTAANLHSASVYVIASPDIPVKNPNPHYMDNASADAIEAWVRAGGVLLLMENDKNNSEFEHFNTLSERFGIHFNPVLRNTVEGRHFEQGMLKIPAGAGGIFPDPLTVYMKEICTITVSGSAQAIYRDRGDVLMAVAHVGKGTVWAVVDPWLYNEYTDGRKLPSAYEDFTAARNVAEWALKQAR
ncbi:hypothetical protein [Silvibacterium dinghuense]|uniref:DUF4159 domain-containing protein n=1 Tax=Silvibacterium dinghuense TaxID=1560006 RepID=A0A4V1NVZ6_9BACT|nr:hypothetical protein [Silvibacterium dinghuense]RXS97652.1 hypothetical protein ESZ00_07185 [Silvibacterium dinghuense]GGH00848.1 hypothetical protein GCM10011586_15590 [Silvibacterium dinghuense]